MERLRLLLLLAIAFGGIAGCSGGSEPDPNTAIHSFVAAEDGNFASARGAFRLQSKGLSYYGSSLTLPGASSCAVYSTASGLHGFGTCDFAANSLADALRIYETWKANTIAAEPGWRSGEAHPPLDGHPATFQAVDDQKHAIYLYIAKDARGYRVTETFATTDAFASH
jgi:hypothetical protein